ncbi:conserved transcriptional regulator, MucR-family (plasmid) [Sinorhizobium fredii NGR234]|uniref:Putative MucR family transcriptional regulatory protein y4pD n=1 Tax=Sinorhizobium fredii (strain NBRC 101917 / NGR234) TaxID=394 RepID=Y4PD_SINFN|nr:MucR family transcriptional regulator [Sinorhizobium fredii]P55613.1 RecName: Full=Putative MucR family transcriptional regulatory protein y4pD [Sinorhizobium fredii NGR234]AAB91814.1 conserved transcriptional regulator, MucR-family [Sinorhizobium fredii NGR234]
MNQPRLASGQRNLELTSRVVSAYLSRNIVPAADLASLIQQTYLSLCSTSQADKAEEAAVEEQRPAVPIKKSVTADFIICLEDGKKFKSLKRHLMAKYGLTPQQYREKWGLPADYPMVASSYAQKRSELARALGLGKKRTAPELGSGLVNHSQKMTEAAMQIAEKKVWAHRS